MKQILILGATSAIAQETAKLFAREGSALYLVARNKERLEIVKQDLLTRGASKVDVCCADLADISGHKKIIGAASSALGEIDTVLIAYGTLSDQEACEKDYALIEAELKTNFLSVVSWLTLLSSRFSETGGQTIAVISSVAGDRARASNPVYGTAKGALSLYLQGLRARLTPKNVHVLTIKPGFVDTPMTAALPKNFLFASPESVGRGIFKAIEKKKDIVYLPRFWVGIMLVIRLIPENIFKKLKF